MNVDKHTTRCRHTPGHLTLTQSHTLLTLVTDSDTVRAHRGRYSLDPNQPRASTSTIHGKPSCDQTSPAMLPTTIYSTQQPNKITLQVPERKLRPGCVLRARLRFLGIEAGAGGGLTEGLARCGKSKRSRSTVQAKEVRECGGVVTFRLIHDSVPFSLHSSPSCVVRRRAPPRYVLSTVQRQHSLSQYSTHTSHSVTEA